MDLLCSSNTPVRIALILATLVLPPLLCASPAQAQQTVEKPKVTDSGSLNTRGLVNLNTASEEELTRLPRIGKSRAQAIIRYRLKRRFKRLNQLRRIRGIGRKTFRLLRPMLTLTGPTTLKAQPVGHRRSATQR